MLLRRLGAVFAATALVALTTAAPAAAHGAPTKPISRTAACAVKGTETGSAACQAAAKANGQPFGTFDNLRIADVNGRDREVVPDGKLCSGGLAAYKGLDLARDDWPATRARAGATISIRYASPIPHKGTFRVYLTKPGYDPEKRLSWDDLASQAILVDKDPPLVDGSYRMTAKLPEDRTGRHILYTIWQTSSTPDTYYSCSDLVLSAAAAPAPKKTRAVVVPKKKAAPAPSARPTTEPSAPEKSAQAPPVEAPKLTPLAEPVPADDTWLYVGLILLAALTGGFAISRMMRGRRAQDLPREDEIR
ncbi:lytic polysaccharide monooxygenase [Actinoplanes sp. NPDC049265]|uniref:lytic polysaccharide monooxygenase n=1 Tax=Actinoplanes sp. NPDC049265 TaxID=3363902 RepID=UPI0037177FC6